MSLEEFLEGTVCRVDVQRGKSPTFIRGSKGTSRTCCSQEKRKLGEGSKKLQPASSKANAYFLGPSQLYLLGGFVKGRNRPEAI
jgi:hypothetical protein